MFKLFKNKSFTAMIISQALGALNDNALRQTYLLLAVQMVGGEQQAGAMAFVALPFIFFSPLAGQLTDRYSKRTVILWTKGAELLVMTVAGFAAWQGNLHMLLLMIFFMFAQSAFFSPAKYGIIPELLNYEQLSEGNGLLQMSSYAAILLGVALAGVMLEMAPAYLLGIFFFVISAVGLFSGWLIRPLPPAAPQLSIDYSPLNRFARSLSWILRDRVLFILIIGFAYAWMAGGILTIVINVYGLEVLGVGELLTSLLFVALALGIGIGSLLAGRWSEKKVELGLIPLGASGLTFSQFFLSLVDSTPAAAYFWLFISGIFSALFLIPFQTALQERPPADKKGDLLATANVFTFTGVILSAAVYVLLVELLGYGPQTVLFIVGAATLVVTGLLLFFLPRLWTRFFLWLYVHLFYRLESRQTDLLPYRGSGILMISGEPSVEKLFLLSYLLPRKLHSFLPEKLFENWLFGKILRLNGCSPAGEFPQEKLLTTVNRLIASGQVVFLSEELLSELREIEATFDTDEIVINFQESPAENWFETCFSRKSLEVSFSYVE